MDMVRLPSWSAKARVQVGPFAIVCFGDPMFYGGICGGVEFDQGIFGVVVVGTVVEVDLYGDLYIVVAFF